MNLTADMVGIGMLVGGQGSPDFAGVTVVSAAEFLASPRKTEVMKRSKSCVISSDFRGSRGISATIPDEIRSPTPRRRS
jgi:hypothetical protein